jgi:molybdopterin-guanine dinucleotide biosynthesis protein A
LQHLSGAILAGGRASRLGGRIKALLPLGGARIIDRQLEALREAGADDPVVVVAPEQARYELPGLRVIPDRIAGAGAIGGFDVAVPRTDDGYHPLCACWSRGALAELERRAAAGLRRIIDAFSALRVREIGPGEVARFDRPAGTLLFNVNTPHDYERAQQLIKSYHDRSDAS